MVVTDWVEVRVGEYGLFEVVLVLLFCFDGLKLFTHQSDRTTFGDISPALFRLTAVILVSRRS